MTKSEIISRLNKLNFAKDDYIIVSSASMVMHDLKKETKDLDLALSPTLLDSIKDDCIKIIGAYGDVIYVYNDFEVSTNFYNLKDSVEIEGFNCLKLEKVLEGKKKLNRRKDQKDIHLIEVFTRSDDLLSYEKDLYNKGITLIGGIDEAGRGPLCGPVVAACVILPKNYHLTGLDDSKKISEPMRNKLFSQIIKDAVSYGVGIVESNVIDQINILEASKLAMKQAISNMKIKPKHVLIDAVKLDIDIPSTSIIKGDSLSLSIAAASIIAKVTRDNILIELDKKYPEYGYKKHKGYPTKEHLENLKKYGIKDFYRKSYKPVADLLENIKE